MELKLTSWLSNRIASERKRLGLTQREIAKCCKVTIAEWKRYESGENCPNSDTFFLMGQLGMDMNFLFKGEHFTEEEINLVEQYRNIGAYNQSIIHTIIYKLDTVLPQMDLRVNIQFMPDESEK